MQTVPAILLKFAQLLGTEVKNNRLSVPEKFGQGYCAGFVFNEHIRLLISNYVLHEDLMVSNPDINAAKRMLFFKFQNIFPKNDSPASPSVLIGTSRLNTGEVIAIHSNTEVINIEVDAAYLSGQFDLLTRSPVLQGLLANEQPLLFEQMISPALQHIVNEMVAETDDAFHLLFLRIKAEELICRLLMELEKREEKQMYPLNINDLQTIYQIKEQILARLDVPPVIAELAVLANMSPTKLKRLFRQIFGNSIFNYYQEFRMKEAARLLKDEQLSVSAAGYRLGFSNLSHFSRVFATQIGLKPKQYSRS